MQFHPQHRFILLRLKLQPLLHRLQPVEIHIAEQALALHHLSRCGDRLGISSMSQGHKRAFRLDTQSLQARMTLPQVRLPRLDEQEHVHVLQSRLARSAAEQDLRIRRLEVHLVPAKKRRLGSSRRHEAKQCESVVPRRITIHSQPMQPDPSSRHPVGGFPSDENAILCKPLTELARKKLSDLPPGEEKPGNHDDQGDHNQAEQNPQTTTAARRWPRMRQEIAHAFFMLPPRATGPRLTECLSFIQKRPRASQGTAVRSVAASPAVLPAMPKTLKSWSRCVGRLERYLTANPRRGP